jgi:ribosomal protein S18 acetylase RimI-like enzyme
MLQQQSFDSEVFGAPVARLIEPAAFVPKRNPDEWRMQKVWLVSCRVSADDDRDVGPRLRDGGFRRIENLVTLEHDFSEVPALSDYSICMAGCDDIASCQSIARAAFIYSRYNRDPQIHQERAAEYKARWVENSIRGRADAAFVERGDAVVRGFNFCLLNQDVAVIDLIAVDAASQGTGIGKALIYHALRHYKNRANIMRVGTQLENATSLAVYSSCGFREVSRAVTYHWINRDAAA